MESPTMHLMLIQDKGTRHKGDEHSTSEPRTDLEDAARREITQDKHISSSHGFCCLLQDKLRLFISIAFARILLDDLVISKFSVALVIRL